MVGTGDSGTGGNVEMYAGDSAAGDGGEIILGGRGLYGTGGASRLLPGVDRREATSISPPDKG